MNLHWNIIITPSPHFSLWFALGVVYFLGFLRLYFINYWTVVDLQYFRVLHNDSVMCMNEILFHDRLLQDIECSSLCYTVLAICFIVVFQSLSCVPLFETPWTAACQASLTFTISQIGRDGWMASLTQWTISLSKLWQIVFILYIIVCICQFQISTLSPTCFMGFDKCIMTWIHRSIVISHRIVPLPPKSSVLSSFISS